MATAMAAASANALRRSGVSRIVGVSARKQTAVSTATAARPESANSVNSEEPDDVWDAEQFKRDREDAQRYFESLGYTEETFYAMVSEEVKSHWREKNEREALNKI